MDEFGPVEDPVERGTLSKAARTAVSAQTRFSPEMRASAEREALKEMGLTERPPRGTAEWLIFQDVLDTHKQIAAISGDDHAEQEE